MLKKPALSIGTAVINDCGVACTVGVARFVHIGIIVVVTALVVVKPVILAAAVVVEE